jgi:hypothetical protein
MVVEPPEELPPLPRESGRRGDGGETGAPLFNAAKTGARFFCAFKGDLSNKCMHYNMINLYCIQQIWHKWKNTRMVCLANRIASCSASTFTMTPTQHHTKPAIRKHHIRKI